MFLALSIRLAHCKVEFNQYIMQSLLLNKKQKNREKSTNITYLLKKNVTIAIIGIFFGSMLHIYQIYSCKKSDKMI